jgi:hypothetical protein
MTAKHLRRTGAPRALARALTVPVVLGVALAGIAAPAFAGKPDRGTSSGSSLSVVVKDGPDALPNFGETITFAVTSSVERKWVDLTCYQGGQWVYTQSAGFFPDYPWAPDYRLASVYWTAGAASCDARLYTQTSNGKQSTLARLTFTVSA